ncbi:hypothetical protein BJF93_09045 [Xaviernesmea oryzae]|uniref:Uncharacterized protein n=1 Tax=Xaviernesmea oryzae TaxID=464029 RepID=A0A1Q9B3P7_9HYPH|nr:hypothetical protein BJF93_09045 [Xaviernesmea oryzae]
MNRSHTTLYLLPSDISRILHDVDFAFLIPKHGITCNDGGFSPTALRSPFEISLSTEGMKNGY